MVSSDQSSSSVADEVEGNWRIKKKVRGKMGKHGAVEILGKGGFNRREEGRDWRPLLGSLSRL